MKKSRTIIMSSVTVVGLGLCGLVTAIAASMPTVKRRDYSTDVKTCAELSSAIKDHGTFATMSDMIDFLKNEKGVDFEQLTGAYENQYVWDQEQNAILTIGQKDKIYGKPDGYDESRFNKSRVWKMVNLSSSNAKLKSSNSTPNIDVLDPNTEYAQYIRAGQTSDKEIEFSSSLDTGNNKNLNVKYVAPEEKPATFPIITTYHSNLTIDSSKGSIVHFGNASSITINNFDSSEQSLFYESGVVDSNVVLNAGRFVVNGIASVNTIVVTSNNVAEIKVESTLSETTNVGSVVKTETVTKQLGDIVKVTSTLPEEKKPSIEDDPYPVPAEMKYAGGLGTAKSPYTISTKAHLLNCAKEYNEPGVTNGAGYIYFKLINNIDLEDEQWTPIGKNYGHRFRGMFDGNGFTIKNFIPVNEFDEASRPDVDPDEDYSDRMYLGLFGITDGDTNTSYTQNSDIWDDENNKIKSDCIKESNYKTVIKNLTLEGVKVNATGKTKDTKCIGGLAGTVTNTYIENVHVKSGYVCGDKNVGGIVGSLDGSIIALSTIGDNSPEAAPFVVSATNRNIGGVLGATSYDSPSKCDALIGCETCSNVTVSAFSDTHVSRGGYVGGVLGMGQNSKALIIDGCTNRAAVNVIKADMTGIAGVSGQSGAIHAIANCLNTGNIETTGCDNQYVAGIATRGKTAYINCKNTGNINASASKGLAGISSGYVDATPMHEFKLVECSNTGQLTNQGSGKVSNLCSDMQELLLENITFKDVDELNNAISGAITSSITLELKNCTVLDNTGTLNILPSMRSIKSNTKICSNVEIQDNATSLSIDIPDINIVVSNTSECDLVSLGANSTITIEEGASIKNASVCGEGSSITNNGTITGAMGIEGKSVLGTNNGTCARVSFGSFNERFGEGEKKLVNNNLIYNKSAAANSHILYCIQGATCNITVENHGTIKYENNGQATPGYISCLYQQPQATIKCYDRSKIISDVNYFFAAGQGGLKLQVRPYAYIYLNDQELNWDSFAGNKIVVEHI